MLDDLIFTILMLILPEGKDVFLMKPDRPGLEKQKNGNYIIRETAKKV
jgi:hypothetical protein